MKRALGSGNEVVTGDTKKAKTEPSVSSSSDISEPYAIFKLPKDVVGGTSEANQLVDDMMNKTRELSSYEEFRKMCSTHRGEYVLYLHQRSSQRSFQEKRVELSKDEVSNREPPSCMMCKQLLNVDFPQKCIVCAGLFDSSFNDDGFACYECARYTCEGCCDDGHTGLDRRMEDEDEDCIWCVNCARRGRIKNI